MEACRGAFTGKPVAEVVVVVVVLEETWVSHCRCLVVEGFQWAQIIPVRLLHADDSFPKTWSLSHRTTTGHKLTSHVSPQRPMRRKGPRPLSV